MSMTDQQLQPEQRVHISYERIIELVEFGSNVLDLGCGDGELLVRLMREKQIRGRGVDIEESMILQCISKGLSVFQGNLEEGLRDYPTGSYDYVILNHTLQMIHDPAMLIQEMVRVGRYAVVNFPNFAHILNRVQLALGGRMPVNRNIPYEWYNTPNIHFCTRKDFVELCSTLDLEIVRSIDMTRRHVAPPFLHNWLSTETCFVLKNTPRK
ncbi:MAG: methionine biosynthesis protein MetW [Spirochaeta sp.]|nr:methionine biosynthesis protein MetW [Spirochaeta sp.]